MIYILFILLGIVALVGFTCCMRKKTRQEPIDLLSPGTNTVETTVIDKTCKAEPGKWFVPDHVPAEAEGVIVLVTGLGGYRAQFTKMAAVLQERFPRLACITHSPPFEHTRDCSISTQAALLGEDLKRLTQPVRVDEAYKPIILIGHSQGGNRSIELYRQHQEGENGLEVLNIAGIVAIGSPLEGAPLAQVNVDQLEHIPRLLNRCMNLEGMISRLPQDAAGIKDVCPDSEGVKRVLHTLKTASLEIMLIAGQIGRLQRGLLSVGHRYLPKHELEMLYGAGNAYLHDFTVPVPSQRADSIDNPRVLKYTVDNLIHDNGFLNRAHQQEVDAWMGNQFFPTGRGTRLVINLVKHVIARAQLNDDTVIGLVEKYIKDHLSQ